MQGKVKIEINVAGIRSVDAKLLEGPGAVSFFPLLGMAAAKESGFSTLRDTNRA